MYTTSKRNPTKHIERTWKLFSDTERTKFPLFEHKGNVGEHQRTIRVRYSICPLLCILHAREARAISKVYIFVGACGAEGAIVINEHKMAILYINDHVEFAIASDILECQGHRRQVLSISDQCRTNEYPGFCAITARKFY